jgi:hypothetical protein
MLEILAAPPHVAAFHFHGTLTGEDYDRCIDEIEARLAAHARIAVFSDLSGMTGLAPEAVAKDLRYALGKIGEFHRFARAAIVTERDWLARVTAFSAMFFPRTDLRTFAPAERDAALAWASEVPPEA